MGAYAVFVFDKSKGGLVRESPNFQEKKAAQRAATKVRKRFPGKRVIVHYVPKPSRLASDLPKS